ncbi:MAG: GH1 family beta-glucosidase [Ferruginibacter sp.]
MAHPFSMPAAADFGKDFLWGVATAAAQNEGAAFTDGRTASIWDNFAKRSGKIKAGVKPTGACDFYHRYKEDLLLVKALGFKVFRFSISWSRVLPEGTGKINKEGIAFYNNIIDECLQLGLIPFVTLYHWDLPQVLEKEGGWTSHRMMSWFTRFATVCAEAFGDRVKHWMVLNEPMGFTSLGYMLGKHAPGKTGLKNFFPAVHNAVLAQADGGRIIRSLVKQANIGTSFSCSEIIPYTDKKEDVLAAHRMDILMNRLFIEPSLGKGYPREDFKFLEQLELANKAWKYTERMRFDFDFIGLQNYFPLVIRYNALIPVVHASDVKASARKVPYTAMGWEVNADSFYRIIRKFWKYGSVKQIIITENGAAYKDNVKSTGIHDPQRIDYFQKHLEALHRAQVHGVNIGGYFAWTLMDNFEWAEGYKARFGLVHVDHNTQLRSIKDSGYWFRDFLTK